SSVSFSDPIDTHRPCSGQTRRPRPCPRSGGSVAPTPPEVWQIRRRHHHRELGELIRRRQAMGYCLAHAVSACPAGLGARALPNPTPPPLETVFDG
ncbi:unnamed protein product, partial [Urochloa humidicola]